MLVTQRNRDKLHHRTRRISAAPVAVACSEPFLSIIRLSPIPETFLRIISLNSICHLTHRCMGYCTLDAAGRLRRTVSRREPVLGRYTSDSVAGSHDHTPHYSLTRRSIQTTHRSLQPNKSGHQLIGAQTGWLLFISLVRLCLSAYVLLVNVHGTVHYLHAHILYVTSLSRKVSIEPTVKMTVLDQRSETHAHWT